MNMAEDHAHQKKLHGKHGQYSHVPGVREELNDNAVYGCHDDHVEGDEKAGAVSYRFKNTKFDAKSNGGACHNAEPQNGIQVTIHMLSVLF